MSITEGRTINDVVLFELAPEHGFCRSTGTIAQNGAATAGLEIGQVLEVSGGKYVVCTTGGNATRILLQRIPLADLLAGDIANVPMLVSGPALLKSSGVIIATAQLAAATAALLAIAGRIEIRAAATSTTTQTT